MDDIGKELLKKIKEDFSKSYNDSKEIAELLKKVKNKKATYEDAHRYSIVCGKLLSRSYNKFIKEDVLPDGRMYWNIAKTILEPTLGRDHKLISSFSCAVQKNLNKEAKLGLNAISPKLNQDRVYGIMNKIANAKKYDEVSYMLKEPIITFSQSIVDDAMKENVEFHSKSGLNPVVKRITVGNCCKWCMNLAGTYKYPDDVPSDFYRRHGHCRCMVTYIPKEGGRVQDVYSKKWFEDEAAKKKRIEYSNVSNVNLTFEERGAIIKYVSPDAYLLNDKLRNHIQLTEIEKQWIQNLDNALKKMPKYQGSVTRDLNFMFKEDKNLFLEQLENGMVVDYSQFLSSTTDKVYNEDAEIRFHIISKNGRDIRKFNKKENEILFERNSKFRILHIDHKSEMIEIYMEEVKINADVR